MPKATILAVDDNPEELDFVTLELRKRYRKDYQIIAEGSPRKALELLNDLKSSKLDLVMILSDQWMPEMEGIELLRRARGLFPQARRMLMINRHPLGRTLGKDIGTMQGLRGAVGHRPPPCPDPKGSGGQVNADLSGPGRAVF